MYMYLCENFLKYKFMWFGSICFLDILHYVFHISYVPAFDFELTLCGCLLSNYLLII